MNSSEFNQCVDDTLEAIEVAIEACNDGLEEEIEFDTANGILTLEFTDRSRIIINRQSTNAQLWVAARSGGFHFNWKHADWLDDREQIPLRQKLSQLVSEQAGARIELEINLK